MNNKQLIETLKGILLAYACIFVIGYIYAAANMLIITLTDSLWIFSIAYIGIGYLIVKVFKQFCNLDKITLTVLSIFTLIMTIVQSEIFLALMMTADTLNLFLVFRYMDDFTWVLYILFWYPLRYGILTSLTPSLDNMSHILFLAISVIYTAKEAFYNSEYQPYVVHDEPIETLNPEL